MELVFNKKYIYLLFLYYLIITLISIVLLIFFKTVNILLVSISFYVFGSFIFLDYVQNKKIITMGILFNVFGLLYTNYYLLENLQNVYIITDSIIKAFLLSNLSMLFFNIGYFLIPYKKSYIKISSVNEKRILYGLVMMFLVALFIEYYVIFIKIGLFVFFHANRSQQSLLIGNYSSLTFYKSFFSIVQMCSLYFYINNKNKKFLYLFIISLMINIFNCYISVSRAEIFSFILPTIYILYYFKLIKTKQVIISAICVFVLFGAWKSLVWNLKENKNISKENINVSFDSEFNTWYSISDNILLSDYSYLYGKSYIDTVYNLIVPITHTEPLSRWYLKIYEPNIYSRGGGRGFSGVIEAYLNFGVFGNIFIYTLYGILFKKLSNIDSELKLIIFLILLGSIYQLFRSESYSLWKTMYWFEILPTLILFRFSKRRKQ